MDIWEFNHYVFGVLLAILLLGALVALICCIFSFLKPWIKKAMEWYYELHKQMMEL